MLSTSINWEVSGWRAGLQKRIWECSLTAGKSHPAIHETHIPSQPEEEIILLYSMLVQPHPECSVQFWSSQFQKSVKVLEHVQKRSAKEVTGLEGMSYEEQLRAVDLSSLEKRRLGMTFLLSEEGMWRERCCCLLCYPEKCGNGSKLHQGRLDLDIRKHFFTEIV